MDWETFVKTYKPIKNKVKGAAIDGYMFETFGDELKDVEVQAKKVAKGNKIQYHMWTLIDNNDGTNQFLSNGWHWVNRLGYIVTRKPWKDAKDNADVDIEVEV